MLDAHLGAAPRGLHATKTFDPIGKACNHGALIGEGGVLLRSGQGEVARLPVAQAPHSRATWRRLQIHNMGGRRGADTLEDAYSNSLAGDMQVGILPRPTIVTISLRPFGRAVAENRQLPRQGCAPVKKERPLLGAPGGGGSKGMHDRSRSLWRECGRCATGGMRR